MAIDWQNLESKHPTKPQWKNLIAYCKLYEPFLDGMGLPKIDAHFGSEDLDWVTSKSHKVIEFMESWTKVRLVTGEKPDLPLAPTTEGEMLYRCALQMLHSYDDLLHKHERIVFRISASDAACTFWLPPGIAESHFLETHPELDLSVETKEWWDILQDMRSGAACLGITRQVDGHEPVKRFCRPHYAIVSERHKALKKQTKLGLDSLHDQTVLCLRSHVAKIDLEAKLATKQITAQIVTLDTSAQILSWIRNGGWIGILPLDMVPSMDGLAAVEIGFDLGPADDCIYISSRSGMAGMYAMELAEAVGQHWEKYGKVESFSS